MYRPGADHMDYRLRRAPIIGTARRFAVNCHDLPLDHPNYRLNPAQKTGLQGLRRQHRKNPPKRIMRGNPVRQVQEAGEPFSLGLAKCLHRHPVIRSTQNGTDRDDQNIYQLVLLVPVNPWIDEISKMLQEGGRPLLFHNRLLAAETFVPWSLSYLCLLC